MKKFNFSLSDIESNFSSPKDWYEFVRSSEIQFSLACVNRELGNALEIGAGNGFQSTFLAQRSLSLICTEHNADSHGDMGIKFLARNLKTVDYILCDARDLSRFRDKQFDTIYSSNVLEHIKPIQNALKEFRRVLADDGQMIHLMPSREWKMFNSLGSILKGESPKVHGEFKWNTEEYIAYGCKTWTRLFEENGFVVNEVVGMPFYIGHGNRFKSLIKFGNLIGLSGSFMYILRKG